jgi:hypothetical protein
MSKGVEFTVTDPVLVNSNYHGLHYQARYITFNGRRYTPKQFGDYLRNEILRKGLPAHMRTTSPRWRAGTRRTKRIAHARR